MFANGALAGATGLSSFIPPVERDVTTMSTTFASAVSGSARAGGGPHGLLMSVHALRGAPYRLMQKGTAPYAVEHRPGHGRRCARARRSLRPDRRDLGRRWRRPVP